MTRQEIIDLIVSKAREHGLVPYELLGGAIAESGLNPEAWRQGAWPDWSAGLFQQTVAFADEGDRSASPENVALIKGLYFDPVHATDIAAGKFKHWRYDPEVSALQAWCAYNLPASYKQWPNVSNVEQRENYRAGLAQAQAILGATPMPDNVVFNPAYPTVLQDDEASCAPTSLTWAMRAIGRAPADNWIEQDMLKHGYWNMELGLLDHRGKGIVDWLSINDAQHYGSDGYGISNWENPISWEQLTPELGDASVSHPPYPVLLGLPNWGGPGRGHWTGVRGFKDGRILLANPGGTGPVYGQQSLSRDEFIVRAANNASIVRVLHPDLITAPPVAAPAPAPPPDPTLALIAQQLDIIDAATREIRRLTTA